MRPKASLSLAVLGLLMLVLAAPAGAAGPRLTRAERAIVRAIDRHRADAGLRAVRSSRALARAADLHSREMLAANYFAHTSRNGASFAARIHRFTRARRIGETLGMVGSCGRRGARRVVRMWMHSSLHRRILLTRGFHRVGVAMRSGRLGSRRACMVTADFAR
jgi:uncharacterized protein YkwD